MKPLHTVFDLVILTFIGEGVLKQKENRKLRSSVVNDGVERLGKEVIDAETARCLSTKGLLMEYMEVVSGWVWVQNEGRNRLYGLDGSVHY